VQAHYKFPHDDDDNDDDGDGDGGVSVQNHGRWTLLCQFRSSAGHHIQYYICSKFGDLNI